MYAERFFGVIWAYGVFLHLDAQNQDQMGSKNVLLGHLGHIAKKDMRRPTKSRNIGHRNGIFVYIPNTPK